MNRKYDSRQCFLPVEKKATWHEIVQIKKQQQSAIPIKEAAAAPPQTVQHHQPYQLREKNRKAPPVIKKISAVQEIPQILTELVQPVKKEQEEIFAISEPETKRVDAKKEHQVDKKRIQGLLWTYKLKVQVEKLKSMQLLIQELIEVTFAGSLLKNSDWS